MAGTCRANILCATRSGAVRGCTSAGLSGCSQSPAAVTSLWNSFPCSNLSASLKSSSSRDARYKIFSSNINVFIVAFWGGSFVLCLFGFFFFHCLSKPFRNAFLEETAKCHFLEAEISGRTLVKNFIS